MEIHKVKLFKTNHGAEFKAIQRQDLFGLILDDESRKEIESIYGHKTEYFLECFLDGRINVLFKDSRRILYGREISKLDSTQQLIDVS